MLEAMAVPLDEIPDFDRRSVLDFSFRLRSYSARLHQHKRSLLVRWTLITKHLYEQRWIWTSVLDYLAIERLYQELCLGKYETDATFLKSNKEVEEEMKERIAERKYIEGWNKW